MDQAFRHHLWWATQASLTHREILFTIADLSPMKNVGQTLLLAVAGFRIAAGSQICRFQEIYMIVVIHFFQSFNEISGSLMVS